MVNQILLPSGSEALGLKSYQLPESVDVTGVPQIEGARFAA
jgi:hypothetical protein